MNHFAWAALVAAHKTQMLQHNCHWEQKKKKKWGSFTYNQALKKKTRATQQQAAVPRLATPHACRLALHAHQLCPAIFTTTTAHSSGVALVFFHWPQILSSSVFIQLQGHYGTLPGEHKAPGWTTDLQSCYMFLCPLLLQLWTLCSISREVFLIPQATGKVHFHCVAAFDRFVAWCLWYLALVRRHFRLLCWPVYTQVHLRHFTIWMGSNYTLASLSSHQEAVEVLWLTLKPSFSKNNKN